MAEIELRHGVAVGSFAAVGPRRGQRVHVLDPYWTRDWAAEELAGRRLPASLEQLEEERQDNAYDKAGFLSFIPYGVRFSSCKWQCCRVKSGDTSPAYRGGATVSRADEHG